ncbi:hypothetical protein Bca52824_025276 [Brassica carinata]|uniref:Non-haem dioxygenase N-terminal domain-containing protein n=1 Tax=Brassica carinata TaxID=52824 RepID=A0A8X8AUR0_BRACI|nr:hypothetical protein Bca52824_025276 [Brassica carinata]
MSSITEDVSIENLSSLQTLPDSFTWKHTAADSVLPPSSAAVKESIPIINLSDPDVTTLLGNACKTWGAFQIANHGVPQKLLDDIESLSKPFSICRQRGNSRLLPLIKEPVATENLESLLSSRRKCGLKG